MIEIKDLLSNFSNILLKEEIKKDSIRDIISQAINLKIKREDIEIKNGTIYLNIKPIYKNEIFLKQEEILLKLKEVFNKKSPQNIR